MKRSIISVLLSVLFFHAVASAQLKQGDFLAICGDSITEQRIYSVFVEDYLLICRPEMKLRAMNHGWSGQSTWDFAQRMRDDTLRYQPTIATTLFGMNDGGYAPLNEERRSRFRASMQEIIDTFKRNDVRVVIASPSVVDSATFKRTDPATYNATLNELRNISKELAARNGVGFADVYGVMNDVMVKAKAKYGSDYDIAGRDGIHPQANGHLVIAYALLKALGCDGDIGTITVDLSHHQADASAGHTIKSFDGSAVTVESTRYPFCFTGDPAKPNSTRGIIEFFPFNDDLNRFRLIVHGAPAEEKMTVTWGTESRQYTGAQLEAGINLAAEFLDNPFGEYFSVVNEAVRRQQNYELPMIKQFVHPLPQFMSMVPADGEKMLQQVADEMNTQREQFAAEAAGSLMPVTHVIRIEKAQPAPPTTRAD